MRNFILVLFLALALFSCRDEGNESMVDKKDIRISLRWIPSHSTETEEEALISFKWAMSFLGAELPAEEYNDALKKTGDNHFEVDFRKMGFSDSAEDAIRSLTDQLKSTEEYEVMNAIDMARFILLTLNSSYHYYAVTGAEKTIKDFLEGRNFDEDEIAIVSSSVSQGHRLIRMSEQKEVAELFFVSMEGKGKIDEGNFEEKEYEIVEIMKNGQSRFAVYDENGDLIPAGHKEFSVSGKPSKCIWCHETFIQPNFLNSPSVDGYVSVVDFNKMVINWNGGLDSMRQKLNTALDFQNQSEHELMEIAYISFMEPSVERLSLEWNMSISELESKLSAFDTHQHPEFPFLGDLYTRSEIEGLSPYSSLAVPYDAREMSIFEPLYIEP